ncbi:MAG: CoA-binding protein [Deltaproteobacteria bacterium]|nr:CoA-binding protein [Deltaproteobacteria bacterium]
MHANLRSLFDPDAVAVIGASDNPGKLGFHVMKSLTQGKFPGKILPINPGAPKIMGIDTLPDIRDYPGKIDLAIIVLPAQLVYATFEQCIEKGVRGIVLITAGFKEIEDPQGAVLQESLAGLANRAHIPVIGPNTFGMINIHRSLNASFTPEFSLLAKGGVTLVSQSGGISHLLAFMAMAQGVGVSKIVGLGNRLNVDFAEVLAYLLEDPETRVIVLYLEGLDDPRRLLAVAGENHGRKRIIAYKTGRAQAGDRASLSHTGSMAGKQEIYEGALRQAGIPLMDGAESLLDAARVLDRCPLPRGPGIAILTGQAGPGMAACDVCELEGLTVPSFTSKTQGIIHELLPPLALRTNPVDMGPAWYNASAIEGIVRAVATDEKVDGIILLMMFASANRDAVAGITPLLLDWKQKKPVITCLVSPAGIWDEKVLSLEQAGAIVNFPTPERAALAMASLWRCKQNMNGNGNG